MSDPNDLADFLSLAWRHLLRGVADARSPARYLTFATVSPEGRPEARTVALRAASQSTGVLEVHTDILTPKVMSLKQTPMAALHVWVPRSDLQIRITAEVEIRTGPEMDAQWDKVPSASRVSYGTMPVPGTPIDHVYAYEKPAERSRFAVLRCQAVDIDLVELGARHRRAIYRLNDGWRGTWVAP